MKDERIIQIYYNDTWMQTDFDKLKEGDKFRLFDKSGDKIIDRKGRSEFIASSSPFINQYGDLVVSVYQ